MSIHGDKELVKLCLKELCSKMGYARASGLSQSDLEHLCYLIEKDTRIVISLSTLKRIFNEKYERLPQAATLDAITLFIGYSGWLDFKTKKNVSAIPSINLNTPADHETKPRLPKYGYAALILCTAILLFTFFRVIFSDSTNEVQFSVKKIVSEGLPKSVVFSYNIDHVKGDSFYIQPSWNKNIRTRISKNNFTRTETYYEPGYHVAKIICDGKVLAKVPVHIPTKDWIGYSKVNFFDPYPEYFRSEYIIRDSVLGIDPEGLKASNIKTDDNKIYYYACFPDTIQVSSDNFSLKARVRMKRIRNTLCPWIISEVYSENSFFYFKGTIPGCTGEIQAMFSENYLDGKTNDLSSFGFDVLTWSNVEINVLNKKVVIYIEGNKVFENTYSRPGGLVKGMGFGANGLCEVDFVELRDENNRVAYYRDF